MLALIRLWRSEALRLSIGFANRVKRWVKLPLISSPIISVKLHDAKRF
jgi:hypothetical protein